MSILTLLLAAAPLTTMSSADVLSCPERIQTRQVILSRHEGWEPIHRNVGLGNFGQIVGFADGKQPSAMKPAKTTKSERNGGTVATTWSFSRASSDIHVICAYDGTDIELVRPLPSGLTSCTIERNGRTGRTKATCS